MFPDSILTAVRSLLDECAEADIRIVTAESCTGGLISGALTSVSGSSRVFDRGFVAYSHASKQSELLVPRSLSEAHGAVSKAVAIAMAEGALQKCAGHAHLSLSVTGIAEASGTDSKPAGLVHMVALMNQRSPVYEQHQFPADSRLQVRLLTVSAALELARRCVRNSCTS